MTIPDDFSSAAAESCTESALLAFTSTFSPSHNERVRFGLHREVAVRLDVDVSLGRPYAATDHAGLHAPVGFPRAGLHHPRSDIFRTAQIGIVMSPEPWGLTL